MDVKVLGAANEVGRSGFLVNCNGTNLLLDYGVMFGRRGTPPAYPLHVKPKDLDAIIITHAHLDHSGNVPSLFVSGNTDVYATPPTFDLSELLIEDMLKIEKNSHPFDLPELNNMMKNAKEIGFKQKITKGNATFELRESGHVIGGSTILVESEKKRLFYTGDIKPNGSRMLREADFDVGEIDLLITESTYSQTEQKPRRESEKELVEFANEVMDRKGILFIPSFSVERSQEIACILKSVNFKHRIIMDGMALKVNEIMFRHPEYLRDSKVFADAINSATAIREHSERKRAMEEPCVVISPAGMLVGGNAVFYLQQLSFDDKNGIALVSYQGEGTPGEKLLKTGKVSTRGKDVNVTAEVKQFEFSGHGDRNELFDMMKKIKGNPKVLTVHGDSKSCDLFAQEIHEKFGFEAHAPIVNETITV
ncbi:MBL fold metallo-hydrolase [Marine Group I thaumarchaeote]|uniref:MBL fold metallo-hydrolase n=1 Tax=Marine Group I thaumarchaeote TaxID=2511932 RepID=A0A7K4MJS8_9ARCH|nr:MAG: MBL fold metallo-hydrolase [Nitrosopumilus sp. YT1]NMI82260.1 MBL fold metallo-hydrolase [Candidatus Nitrosopumilus sp. MTA1]NWJ29466.1 MBL fold metallo-hydrolase [Marine Group I thaumarchaeote]NWJ56291.1 MBL fold metallo-hydrolase [Marine Group I thaumarchaeote]NWJ84120.1 MBL fold metallo-hydrolase [Marine Group I thaumarchaeote]